MHFISVDLPAPDVPVNPTISPCSIANETPSSARMVFPPCTCSVNSLCSSSTARMSGIERRSHGSEKRADEQLGVGVLRVLQNLIGQSALDDVAVLEDDR